ncbi:MAG: host-nuclease inhibitor Gam family protein [Methylovulum miyakonense]|uniref:host-nuclease inhibitor Gam family protein n=1 Tax=Methylovulum miyakonense TaxID=645578 RepID=UPI003BB49255
MSKNRLKKPAITHAVPSDKDACALDINKIGTLSREIAVLQAAMNDEIAVITDKYTGQFSPLQAEIANVQQGVQIFCEANRDELTQNGKMKTASFLTGTVQWRQRPPSVSARGVDAVIEALKSFGLDRFIRTKEELNKEAILNEPAAVAGVAGLTIKKGVEDFVIQPFEIEEAA